MIKFVVCVWNAENYIKNCIKTLLNQKDTNSVITSSNQIWDIIGFCRKEFAK